MTNLSPPSCLKPYHVRPITDEEANRYEMTSDSITRFYPICSCGCDCFDTIHYSEFEENPASPLYALCRNCNKRELLFDAEIHGHDAMFDDSIAGKGTSEEAVWTCPECRKAGRIILSFGYSYTGEDFADLLKTAHIEDYFDGLMVFHVCAESGSLHFVAGYECA